MANLSIKILNDFLLAARGQPQSEILKAFLRMVVFSGELSESGSILIRAPDRKLRLFNDHDFLFREKFLDSAKQWKVEFELHEGLAGRAFATSMLQYSDDVSQDKRYVGGDEPIKSMVCAPIVLPTNSIPFGVASFHNGPGGKTFDDDTRGMIQLAVQSLTLALQASEQQLHHERSKNVFIVYGRDTAAVNALQLFLVKRSVRPVVLSDEPGTGAEILEKLDEILAECRAGFVLLTPDDVGRLQSTRDERPRARQNVIFEAGWLTALFRHQRKICFLKAGDLEFPSDINGVLYEPFDATKPDRSRLEKILTEWGIDWIPPR